MNQNKLRALRNGNLLDLDSSLHLEKGL